MDALAKLKGLRDAGLAPRADDGTFPPSNGQLRRWLQNGSVSINGSRPGPEDEVEAPFTVTFFPGKPRQTTVV